MRKESKKKILKYIGRYMGTDAVNEMKNYIQHGSVSTYKHCINVVKLCYIINEKYKLNADKEVLFTSALFHDMYLYDWHDGKLERSIHGYTHPFVAAKNASRIYGADERICSCIETHMWPLTFFHIPRLKEAWILCIADKLASTAETLWM